MKFIVNSKSLRKLLKETDLDILDKDSEINISSTGNRLSIEHGSRVLNVESRCDFDTNVTVKQIRRLSKLAGILEEQPIVITKDSNGWINISGIVL